MIATSQVIRTECFMWGDETMLCFLSIAYIISEVLVRRHVCNVSPQ